jgi:hypothetical protein
MGHSVLVCPECEGYIMEGHNDWFCDKCNLEYNSSTKGEWRKKSTTSYKEVCLHNPIVNQIITAGGTAEDCVVALNDLNRKYYQQIRELKDIAPFKITLPEGKVLIWRCPDEFVPER